MEPLQSTGDALSHKTFEIYCTYGFLILINEQAHSKWAIIKTVLLVKKFSFGFEFPLNFGREWEPRITWDFLHYMIRLFCDLI